MRKYRPFLLILILLFPFFTLHAVQETPRLEITGVNASEMPAVIVTANVYDTVGQPVRGLTAADFTLVGDLVGVAQITSVENITDNNLPFAVVLAIDVSSSMLGTPLERAKSAAQAFIDNLGPNDPVAILSFASAVRVEQDYTTDRSALSAVIDSLEVAGQTALYQGAYDAIQRAAASPTPRRAVILLSDGAEYGGNSAVGREAAAGEALVRGVPVYTIGLGFGTDRSFLQQLSGSTNARAYESPTPDELTRIYTDLAAQLRSQYVITLDVPLALDGTQYNLALQVLTPQGSADATAVLRAPIPVPIVRLPELADPLSEPTDVAATVLADDPITGVTFAVNGEETAAQTEAPFVFTVNPVAYLPGSYNLAASATDADGDTGSGVVQFTVAALPSEIALSPDLAALGALDAPQTITVETGGQTPATEVSVDLGAGATELSERGTFTIDPILFPPGQNSVAVTVTNEGGVTTTQTFPFTVAALPPQVSVIGLEDGQSVGEPVSFSVAVTAQEAVSAISAQVGAAILPPNADGSYTIDPLAFEPGGQTLTVTATSGGRSGAAVVNFVVASLPPQISVDGLSAGDVVSTDRDVSFDFVSQTPVIHVAVFVDSVDLAHLVQAPFGVTLNVLDYPPGEHVMRVIADNASGGSSTLDIPFTIAPEPAATATATTVFATQAAVATATRQAVETASAVQATQAAQATVTQVAQVAATGTSVQATQVAQASATAVQATENALNTAAAATSVQATQAAQVAATGTSIQATQVAQASATALQATENALNTAATATSVQATQVAQVTATQAALATGTQIASASETAAALMSTQATATRAAQASATALQATENALNTAATATSVQATQAALDAAAAQLAADASATQGAHSTQRAQAATATQAALNAAATQLAADASGTQGAHSTQTAQAATATQTALNAAATQNAQSTQVAQAMHAAAATQNAAATLAAQATNLISDATATQAALNMTATRMILDATATQAAQATATQNVVVTLDAQASATAQQQALFDATGDARATQQFVTEGTGTAVALNNLSTQTERDLRATQAAATATQAAFGTGTQGALDSDATQLAGATATQAAQTAATGTQLAQATASQATQAAQAAATEVAQATQAARATMSAAALAQSQGATRAALSTANAQARLQAQATQDARATRSALATATQAANASATAEQATQAALAATATQVIRNATATQAAQATLDILATQAVLDATLTIEVATQAAQSTLGALEATATQRVIAATATRALLETQAAVNSTATQTSLDATATLVVQATNVAQATQSALIAVATAERSGQQTATSQVLADSATATAGANATLRAEILATDAQATVSAGATETADALGTLETRQTAIGPTATPVPGSAQGAVTETPPPVPTLTEVQAQEPPASSDIAPILIVVIVVIVIILVLVLIMRGRGSPIGR